MGVKLEGCIVYIYDLSGRMLATSVITTHNKVNSTIDIEYVDMIEDNAKYELLVLTNPAPHAFSCAAEKRGDSVTLRLFRGEKRELRRDIRYEVRGIVYVITYLDGGKAYQLHTPQNANLINISKGGIRFKMKRNSLLEEDTVQLRFQIEGSVKMLTACVVNHIDREDGFTEYGCKLV